MSRPPESQGEPITDKRQLVDYLAAGAKPKSDWRIGTEHEKFAYDLKNLRPLPYEGEAGIRAILDGMTRFGWQPILEGDKIIALSMDKCAITLEPGGQFELSGAPLETLHQTCSEVHQHLAQVKEVCGEIGAGMMGL
ncbi:MAG: glutamate-cysteine ligase family protein, partial [Oceanibaculum sp.]